MQILISIFKTNSQHKGTNNKTCPKKLLSFRHYQVDPKEIKCHFQWWGKHEAMFHIAGFLVCQILGIIWVIN
jgi:hypothetical protein